MRAADSAAMNPEPWTRPANMGVLARTTKTLFLCTVTGPSPHLQSERNTTRTPGL